jgi:hypothetical protein
MLMGLCWAGMGASLLLVLNVWPRGMLAICFVCFLSFVSAAQDFSGYQSDGMLLEAGFISLFLAPSGMRPDFGRSSPPIRASLFLLQWEWFRIYFESGVAKMMSGDPEWRHFTAMDEYYQNGPLPTWIGWYMQHLPHWFHASTAFATLVLELILVWMLFLPRRWRIVCFFIVTPWELGVIFTANYTFLNYLVLALGVLLLDDEFLLRFLPQGWKQLFTPTSTPEPHQGQASGGFRDQLKVAKLSLMTVLFAWIFYATVAELIWMIAPLPVPTSPVVALEPFRIANRYGLFAVMTRGRYEIEFQGSEDGKTWVAYPFRYKPQDLNKPPGIYALISHGSTGICGSRHWAHGENILSCPERKCVCFRTIATCSVFLSRIRSRRSRHVRCARCFGSIGLLRSLRNVRKACGGDSNSWDFMRRRSNAMPMAISGRWHRLTCNRVSDRAGLREQLIFTAICFNCASTWSTPSSQRDSHTCHVLHRRGEWMKSIYKRPELRWHSDGS